MFVCCNAAPSGGVCLLKRNPNRGHLFAAIQPPKNEFCCSFFCTKWGAFAAAKQPQNSPVSGHLLAAKQPQLGVCLYAYFLHQKGAFWFFIFCTTWGVCLFVFQPIWLGSHLFLCLVRLIWGLLMNMLILFFWYKLISDYRLFGVSTYICSMCLYICLDSLLWLCFIWLIGSNSFLCL